MVDVIRIVFGCNKKGVCNQDIYVTVLTVIHWSSPVNNKSSKKIIIGLGVLIAVIVVGAVAMNGDVINNINGDMKTSEKQVVTNPIPSSANTNSKCGTGTIFDSVTNTCVIP